MKCNQHCKEKGVRMIVTHFLKISVIGEFNLHLIESSLGTSNGIIWSSDDEAYFKSIYQPTKPKVKWEPSCKALGRLQMVNLIAEKV